jgi:predicted XRE-type DNA-binding protein
MAPAFVPPRLPLGATATQTARNVRALRLALIDAIAEHLARTPLPQGELAAMLGISRPRLNRLLKREVELFGLDSLAAIAARAGLTLRLSVSRPYRER